jgi:hypothetical protein
VRNAVEKIEATKKIVAKQSPGDWRVTLEELGLE